MTSTIFCKYVRVVISVNDTGQFSTEIFSAKEVSSDMAVTHSPSAVFKLTTEEKAAVLADCEKSLDFQLLLFSNVPFEGLLESF